MKHEGGFGVNLRIQTRTDVFAGLRRAPVAFRLLMVLAVIGMLFFNAATEHAQSMQDEYRVKAAFLFHFAQLVTWPPNPPSDGPHSFLLCTVDGDPFQGALETIMAGKQIGTRMIHIRHVMYNQTNECTMLFIGQNEDRSLKPLLARLGNAPILTVGESDDFLDAGGMIQFLMEGNKIRFAINRRAAEQAHLTISSQLLLLASKVIGPSEAGRK